LAQIDQSSQTLDIAFDRAISGRPFAALRSMYVTDVNNDVARVAVRQDRVGGWREEGVMAFTGARANELWAGRVTPSRHNTSAPDLVFAGFSEQPETGKANK
jgi:hypothetical protein